MHVEKRASTLNASQRLLVKMLNEQALPWVVQSCTIIKSRSAQKIEKVASPKSKASLIFSHEHFGRAPGDHRWWRAVEYARLEVIQSWLQIQMDPFCLFMNDAENKPGPAKKMGLNMFGKSCSLSRERSLGFHTSFLGGQTARLGHGKYVYLYIYIEREREIWPYIHIILYIYVYCANI